jgi:hypothetical protein
MQQCNIIRRMPESDAELHGLAESPASGRAR